MPNGDPDFNLAECETFFSPLAGTIGRIATLRNLSLQKYYHDSPTWDLCFAHPVGGSGMIHLTRTPEGALRVSGAVWKDVYDEFTRYLRNVEPRPVEKDDAILSKALADLLDDMLAWPFDSRFNAHRGYEESWRWMSKQQFEASPPHFPVPTRTRQP